MTTIIIWYLAGCLLTCIYLYYYLASQGYNIKDNMDGLLRLSILSWLVVVIAVCLYIYDQMVYLYARVLFWWKCRKISMEINHQRKQLQTLKENIARHKSALQQLQDDKTE